MTHITININPIVISVHYDRGMLVNGSFTVVDNWTIKFDQSEISGVDPMNLTLDSLDTTLLTLLQQRLGVTGNLSD